MKLNPKKVFLYFPG